jgi:hypothetical protein
VRNHEGQLADLRGRSKGRWRVILDAGKQCGCCTFLLHARTSGPRPPSSRRLSSVIVVSLKVAALTLTVMLAAGCGAASSAPTTLVSSSPPAGSTGTVVPRGSTSPGVSTSPSSSSARTVTPTPVPTHTHASASHPALPTPSVPTSSAPQPPASCYPTTNSGHCYEPGEYCRNSDHGASGVAGNGEKIICKNNDGWRWEPA